MGRTARGVHGRGRALLLLLPEELAFLRYLKARDVPETRGGMCWPRCRRWPPLPGAQHAKVPLNEYEFPTSKISNVQSQLEKLIEKNYYLHRSARDAYRSYLQAYASHSHKSIFDVNQLDLQAVARAFGFTVPPPVNLAVHSSKACSRRTSACATQPSRLTCAHAQDGTIKKRRGFERMHGRAEKSKRFREGFAGGRVGSDGRQFAR